MRTVLRYITILILLACPTFAWAQAAMRTGDITLPPFGYVEFCERAPELCKEHAGNAQPPVLTEKDMRQLEAMNTSVNRLIEPTEDVVKHNRVGQKRNLVKERWELLNCSNGRDCRGDCEEYALMKRKRMMDRGWPASLLLLTVVRDEKGLGHLVLTFRVAAGDFILDNKVDVIRRWDKVPYQFVMRQSTYDPLVWFKIRPPEAPVKVATSSWSKGAKVHPVR